MRVYTVSAARQNLFKIMDDVLDRGAVISILKDGRRVTLVAEQKSSRIERLEGLNWMIGDEDEFLDLKVSEWQEPKKI